MSTKKNIDIVKEAKKIDIDKVAEEVLCWVILNVENFIDNQAKAFKLDLILDSESMGETTKFQNLYKAVTDNDMAARKELDKVAEKTYKKMKSMKEHLDKLFERMIFYYEMIGVKDGKAIEKQLIGAVDVLQFEYEAFQVGVNISAPKYEVRDGETGERVIHQGEAKHYVIPEGFTIWIEIAFRDKNVCANSMF